MTRTRVYVGGLPQNVRQRDVEQFLEGYGRITEIALKSGFGFAEFSDERDADDAIHDLDGKRLMGRRITVQNAYKPRGRSQYQNRDTFRPQRYRFSPARRTNFKVTVENLSSRVQWQDLKDFLSKVGKVSYAKAHNVHRNQGTVEFASYNDMKKVIEELDGADLNGRKIKIIEVKRSRSKSRSPSDRQNSHSRSRSPVGRKSKSPSRSRDEYSQENSNSKTNSKSFQGSRKRSRGDSEDDSRTANRRSKRSDSGSRSPRN